MAGLAGRTVFVTGASRGIGRAIVLRVAAEGAAVVVAAKTEEPHPELPGTIHTVSEEVEAAGGRSLPVRMDVRSEEQVDAAVARAVEAFGGVDALVVNAGAIHLAGTMDTPVKRYDLMQAVNARAAFICARACIPWLERSDNPHILTMSPPLRMEPRFFAPHLAYTISKYGMSMCVLGLAEELRGKGIAVNALWPRTVIATAALRRLGGRVPPEACRTPDVVAEAARHVLARDSRSTTGRFFLDEDVLAEAGITDLTPYAVDPDIEPMNDLYVD